MIFETWNPDIQESWNPLDLASFCWLQCAGYFSHTFFVPELDFHCEIPKFYHSWNLPGIIWSSGILLEMGYLLPNLTLRVSIELIVMIFHTFGSIFCFLKLVNQTFRNAGIPWIWLVITNVNVYGIFPTQCLSLNLIFNAEFQNFIIPGISLELPGTLEFLWKCAKFFCQLWSAFFDFQEKTDQRILMLCSILSSVFSWKSKGAASVFGSVRDR